MKNISNMNEISERHISKLVEIKQVYDVYAAIRQAKNVLVLQLNPIELKSHKRSLCKLLHINQ